MKIDKKFSQEQIKLLKQNNIDISKDFDKNSLEELENTVYNLMMDNLDEKQDFTPLSEEFERILDIVVEMENKLK